MAAANQTGPSPEGGSGGEARHHDGRCTDQTGDELMRHPRPQSERARRASRTLHTGGWPAIGAPFGA